MSSKELYRLKTFDDHYFEMSTEDVDQSEILSQMASQVQQGKASNYVIPVPNVKGITMKMVVTWCIRHRVEVPSTSTWEVDYVKSLDREELKDAIWAAKYLRMPILINITSSELFLRAENTPVERLDEVYPMPHFVGRAPERSTKITIHKFK